MSKSRYSTNKVNDVIIGICITTDIPGYMETVLNVQLLSEEDMKAMSDEAVGRWIEDSNSRMEKLCELMNKENI